MSTNLSKICFFSPSLSFVFSFSKSEVSLDAILKFVCQFFFFENINKEKISTRKMVIGVLTADWVRINECMRRAYCFKCHITDISLAFNGLATHTHLCIVEYICGCTHMYVSKCDFWYPFVDVTLCFLLLPMILPMIRLQSELVVWLHQFIWTQSTTQRENTKWRFTIFWLLDLELQLLRAAYSTCL